MTGTVTIGSKRWVVGVASTYAELTSGLSGVESMPPQTGMLFILGSDYTHIDIDMSRMLFALDIIFISSTQSVVGIMENVQPGDDATFENNSLPGARYFLEVNAGEASEIKVGDVVAIETEGEQSLVQVMATAVTAMGIVGSVAAVTAVLAGRKKK